MLLRMVSVSAIVLSTITIPAVTASADVVDAMSRDFGITQAQALTRIRAEKVALKIAPAAEQAAADAFGGSWYADGKLKVAVTDPARVEAVKAAGAQPVLRTKTLASLNAVKTGIDRLSKAGSVSKDVAGWRVDVERGAVVVDALPGADVSVLPKDVVVNTDGVQRPQTFAAGTVGGDPFYTGNVRCSIGFSVHGGFVTAGHCGGGGAERLRLGPLVAWASSWALPSPATTTRWVRIGGGWWTVPVVLGWGTGAATRWCAVRGRRRSARRSAARVRPRTGTAAWSRAATRP